MRLIKPSELALAVTVASSIFFATPALAGPLEDYNNGSAYVSMGNLREAIKWFDKAIAYGRKGFADPYVNKGLCLQRLGYHDRAIPCYDAAIKMQPKMAAAYQNRGTAYLHLTRYKESLRDLNMAITLPRPSSLSMVTVYIDRGRALAGLGRWKESFADFDYVLSMQSTSTNMDKLKAAAALQKKRAEALMAQGGAPASGSPASSTNAPSGVTTHSTVTIPAFKPSANTAVPPTTTTTTTTIKTENPSTSSPPSSSPSTSGSATPGSETPGSAPPGPSTQNSSPPAVQYSSTGTSSTSAETEDKSTPPTNSDRSTTPTSPDSSNL
ncbi:MAG: tetratricopeptide repeat protein [Candidatus Melainabacteria bacterium]|nr:tetratricopeptide repeat protein [Candidatus Melainabacteria bacterium]